MHKGPLIYILPISEAKFQNWRSLTSILATKNSKIDLFLRFCFQNHYNLHFNAVFPVSVSDEKNESYCKVDDIVSLQFDP